mgnify:CR=1
QEVCEHDRQMEQCVLSCILSIWNSIRGSPLAVKIAQSMEADGDIIRILGKAARYIKEYGTLEKVSILRYSVLGILMDLHV